MFKSIICWILVASIVCMGCTVSTKRTPVGRFRRGNVPEVASAPWAGTFRLVKLPDGPTKPDESKGTTVDTFHLAKGDALGFKSADNAVYAVAGGREVSIGDGSYEWMMEADSGQIDGVKTALLVVVIAVVVAGAVVLGYYVLEVAVIARAL